MTQLIDAILEEAEPLIIDMIARQKRLFEKAFEREMTPYDIEMARLTLILDLLRAIEIYTLPTDKLVESYSSTSIKGNMQISATIAREDVEYYFVTEAIYAGGHNIQRLHYRYLTRTNLPKTGRSEKTKQVEEHIKKLSKLDKINLEIEGIQKVISNYNKKIDNINSMSDQDILDDHEKNREYGSINITWDEVVKRGADKNYNYNPQEFERSQESYKQSIIQGKRNSITNYKEAIKDNEKRIRKLIAKLEALNL